MSLWLLALAFFGVPASEAWAPVGTTQQIVFVREPFPVHEMGGIWLMNADGSGQTRILDFGTQPDLSRDGTKIVFTSNRDGDDEIYVVNVDGTGLVQLTTNSFADNWPSWSPGGTKIAFTTDRDGNSEIYSMNADGSAVVNLTSDVNFDWSASWSHDGAKIAFASDRYDGYLDVLFMNSDGSAVTRVTNTPDTHELSPSWSPDGMQLALIEYPPVSGEAAVVKVNLDGTAKTTVLSEPYLDIGRISWGLAEKLAFAEYVSSDPYFPEDRLYPTVHTINPNGTGLINLTDGNLSELWEFNPDWGGGDIPLNTSAPSVDGVPDQGQTLTVNEGAWSPAATSYSYQWQRTTPYFDMVQADAPLAYWRLNESGGTVAADSAGGDDAASYVGGPSLRVPGVLLKDDAVGFNGTSQYLDGTRSIQFDAGDFTIEGWFRAGPYCSINCSKRQIWHSGYNGGAAGVEIYLHEGGSNIGGNIGGRVLGASAPSAFFGSYGQHPNDWHHFALVRDDDKLLILVDGYSNQPAGSVPNLLGADVDAAGVLPRIGNGLGDSANRHWSGNLDEIAVYKRALTESEIVEHYNAGVSRNFGDVTGATGRSYTLTAADVGRRMRVVVTGRNSVTATAMPSGATGTLAVDSPVDGAVLPTASPVLKADWGEHNPHAEFLFEVASDSLFTTSSLASSGWRPATNTYAVPEGELKDGGNYFWRVRARDGAETTTWSAPRSLRVRLPKLGSREHWPIWSLGRLAVNQVNGNLVMQVPGPSYPTATGSMAASATYNSLDPGDRELGAGWTFSAGDQRVAGAPARLVDRSLLAAADRFDAAEVVWPDGGSSFYGHVGATATYEPQAGDPSRLTKNADGSWTLVDVDGAIYSFAPANVATGVALLVSAEVADAAAGNGKLVFAFSAAGVPKLTRLTDDAGRSLSLSWNSENPTGCPDAIVCMSGPDGVSWRYVGDAAGGTSGRLARVHNGARDLLALTYDAAGRMVKLQNANDLSPSAASAGYDGTHSLTISYDGQGRVASLTDGPRGGQSPTSSIWSLAYFPGAIATTATRTAHAGVAVGTVRTADGYTTLTPPRQQGQAQPKATKTYYDSLAHPIEVVDLLGNLSLSGYNARDQRVWSEDTDGNPTDYGWDTVNEVLTSVTGPDPDGTGPLTRPVTSMRYDEAKIGTATAPGPALQGLQASYFSNVYLAGRPAARQTDANVDFGWASGGPAALPGVSDSFSVRWSGNLSVAGEGDYVFSTVSDEGTRLTIDDIVAIDNWHDQTVATHSRYVHLTAGLHKLVLEYYDRAGPAEVHLQWSCPNCSPAIPAQVIPSSSLLPGWNNRTTRIDPAGRLAFSHFAQPQRGDPDYTLARLGDGTNLITTISYDGFGRITQKVTPRGNTGRTIDSDGNLQGNSDLTYAMTSMYYGAAGVATPPAACGGGSSANQAQLLKMVSPPGKDPTTFVYDSGGRTVAKTDGAGPTCSSYTAEGRLSTLEDGNGNATSYAYDPVGNVVAVTAADGSVSRTTYDEAGIAVSKTNAENHTTRFERDADGNVTQTISPLNATTTSTYDAAGNRVSLTDPLNHTTAYEYDTLGRLTKTTSPRGKTSTVAYDALGRPVRRTGPRGNATNYAYDASGLLTSVTDALGHVTISSYDALGRLAGKTDANNHTTTFGYDLDGNLVRETVPDGGATLSGYDEVGNLTSRTDPLGHTTSFSYDGANRLITITLPTGQVTRSTYDPVGNRITAVDAAGKTTTYTYDGVNRMISERSPLGAVTQTAYDGVGNLISSTDPLDHTTTFTYDARDRLTATTDPLNHATTLAYDLSDQLLSQTDANSHVTGYGYDNDGNRTSVTAPHGGMTSFVYDDAGNVSSRTDPLGHVISYAYDGLDRVTSRTEPLGRTWTHTYDAVGNRTKVVDANGNATPGDPNDGTTTYGYDPADRPTSINYSDTTPDVSFAYDLAGRQTTMNDGAGTQTYGYDNADRLTSVTRGAGPGFTYGYDSAGRLNSRTYPDGTQTMYGYDNDSRLATVSQGLNTTGYSYNSAGQPTATAYPNGWTEQRSYDTAGRLSEIKSIKGPDTLAAANYTRDPVGNPTQIVREGVTETYSYDNADRITGACYQGPIASCPGGSLIGYSYDTVGNRLSQNKFGTSTAYSYSAADQLTQTVSGGNTTNYTYNSNGNQTAAGTRTFGYDLANRLLQTADAGQTAAFIYDGLGNRLSKTYSGVTTSYAWDENNELPQLALEKNGGTVVRSYLYGGQLLAMNAGGAANYFHHDDLGSTTAITNQTGATQWTYTYDPYGAERTTVKVDTSAADNVAHFGGQLLDPETGLYDLRARIYDPSTGRFLSSDPLSEDHGEPALGDSLYVGGRPTVLTDPSGASPDGWGWDVNLNAYYEFSTGNLYDSEGRFISGSHPEKASSQPMTQAQESAPPPGSTSAPGETPTGWGWDTNLNAYYEFSTGYLYNRDGSLLSTGQDSPAVSSAYGGGARPDAVARVMPPDEGSRGSLYAHGKKHSTFFFFSTKLRPWVFTLWFTVSASPTKADGAETLNVALDWDTSALSDDMIVVGSIDYRTSDGSVGTFCPRGDCSQRGIELRGGAGYPGHTAFAATSSQNVWTGSSVLTHVSFVYGLKWKTSDGLFWDTWTFGFVGTRDILFDRLTCALSYGSHDGGCA